MPTRRNRAKLRAAFLASRARCFACMRRLQGEAKSLSKAAGRLLRSRGVSSRRSSTSWTPYPCRGRSRTMDSLLPTVNHSLSRRTYRRAPRRPFSARLDVAPIPSGVGRVRARHTQRAKMSLPDGRRKSRRGPLFQAASREAFSQAESPRDPGFERRAVALWEKEGVGLSAVGLLSAFFFFFFFPSLSAVTSLFFVRARKRKPSEFVLRLG